VGDLTTFRCKDPVPPGVGFSALFGAGFAYGFRWLLLTGVGATETADAVRRNGWLRGGADAVADHGPGVGGLEGREVTGRL